ncbi:MAG: hypothetical protein M3301_06315, partial [Chloroflexota bacterium]|nr:hypothetical protein [Chloroflexota bacterium]
DGADPGPVVVAGDDVWVSLRAEQALARIDPATLCIVERVRATPGWSAVADGRSVWMTTFLYSTVVPFDLASKRVTADIVVGGHPFAVARGAGAVWAITAGPHGLSRIDPASETVATVIDVGETPRGVAATDEDVWVTTGQSREVLRISAKTNKQVGRIRPGGEPYGIVATGDGVWVAVEGASEREDAVVRIDPKTGRIAERVKPYLGTGRPHEVVTDGNEVWVTSGPAGYGYRVHPAR